MKLKSIYFTVTCLVVLLTTKGQHVAKQPSMKFQSNLQTGVLAGQRGSKATWIINSVNGLQYHNWFAGIGLGIDYYGSKRTIPLFLDVQNDLSAKHNTLFWYANGGYNFPWLKDNERLQYASNYQSFGGLLYEAGAGYRFSLFKKTHVGFSAGYSYKQIKEKFTPPCYWCEWSIPSPQTNNYQFRRIAIKVNWWLL